MKVFETFREFCVFAFTYRAITKNAELAENKIGVIFDWENPWKGIRVSWEIILRLFYLWRKIIIIFHRFRRFREFRGMDLAQIIYFISSMIKSPKLTSTFLFLWTLFIVIFSLIHQINNLFEVFIQKGTFPDLIKMPPWNDKIMIALESMSSFPDL